MAVKKDKKEQSLQAVWDSRSIDDYANFLTYVQDIPKEWEDRFVEGIVSVKASNNSRIACRVAVQTLQSDNVLSEANTLSLCRRTHSLWRSWNGSADVLRVMRAFFGERYLFSSGYYEFPNLMCLGNNQVPLLPNNLGYEVLDEQYSSSEGSSTLTEALVTSWPESYHGWSGNFLLLYDPDTKHGYAYLVSRSRQTVLAGLRQFFGISSPKFRGFDGETFLRQGDVAFQALGHKPNKCYFDQAVPCSSYKITGRNNHDHVISGIRLWMKAGSKYRSGRTLGAFRTNTSGKAKVTHSEHPECIFPDDKWIRVYRARDNSSLGGAVD